MTAVEEAVSPRWATEPFIMGSRDEFARLRSWLSSVGYTEPELCTKAGAESIGRLKSLDAGRTVFSQPVDAQSLLVLLFLDGKRFPWPVVREVLSPDELSILTALGILQNAVIDPRLCVASLALFPSEDLYVASDRLSGMEIFGKGLPADLVYSPLTSEARRFVGLMPRVPCESYLEMCAGTGIAALHAAKKFARYAYAADITERSTRFAQFNAALNGLENFTAVQGDLYEPVAGKTFDLISAHPPYVPSEATEMVFRDGGADGEQITRRILAGLDEFLAPGGLFYLDCVMTDRDNDPIEQRIRRMLGPSEDEFDVVVIRSGTVETKVYQAERLQAGRMTPEAFLRQAALFKQRGIARLVAITALVQRRTTARSVVTRHRTLSGETRAEDLLWLLRYLTGTVEWGEEDVNRLLDSHPRALPFAELRVRSVLRDGVWTPVDSKIETVAPFATVSPCPPWFPVLLSRCDGRATAREQLDRLRLDGIIPDTTTNEDFAQLIRELADVPFFELELFPLPPMPERNPTTIA
ncbi:MAG TPA: class I SAM-dependent methyltransferase [Gemmatimonadaceae bacterium]|nr:class I SAM-dependent methyltransferase [Gemmatimonadaceae bacterium]